MQEMAVPLEWKETLDGVDWQEVADLYRAAPLGDKQPEALRTAFTNSMFRVLVYDEGRLVAAGRALADGADCSYVCDLAVLPSHQGMGLGRRIMQRLIDLSAGHRKIILYAAPGKEGFYSSLGFQHMRTAMAIFADPAHAAETGLIDSTPDSDEGEAWSIDLPA
jgi:GNAT superfamily N-acetyltransferase